MRKPERSTPLCAVRCERCGPSRAERCMECRAADEEIRMLRGRPPPPDLSGVHVSRDVIPK